MNVRIEIDRIEVARLQVARVLYDFITAEALAGSGVTAAQFWTGLSELIHDLGPLNRQLLGLRLDLQTRIDDFHRAGAGEPVDRAAYERFLRKIGYLLPEPADFAIRTANVDDEIAHIAGPQLVVPLSNARYALNAANARWGSLYDALYGTDAIPEDGGATRGSGYNKVRGLRVIARAREILDMVCPLLQGSHKHATAYVIENGQLVIQLDSARAALARSQQFVGFLGEPGAPSAILLRNHGLHLEIRIDRSRPVARDDPAGIADVILEAAITTIMDLEDSVAAVDADDKVEIYRNWLELTKGTLTARFDKAGRMMDRRLNPDRTYKKPGGGELTLPGRSLMLIRNVGNHMYTDAVRIDAQDVPESIVDAAVTSLIAVHDLRVLHPLR